MEAKDNDLDVLRRAVLDDPRNGERRYLLGAELAERRDYEGAVLEMSAALALNPFMHVARLQLGLLHLTMAQTHHAVAVLGLLEELPDDSALKHSSSRPTAIPTVIPISSASDARCGALPATGRVHGSRCGEMRVAPRSPTPDRFRSAPLRGRGGPRTTRRICHA
jgi:hypothetical protein